MSISLRSLVCLFSGVIFSYSTAFSQPVQLDMKNYKVSIESPYRLELKKELIVGIGSVALIATGSILKLNKPDITQQEIDESNTDHIPSFDISAIHQYDDEFLTASNVLLYTAMAMPFISFADKRVSGHAPQIITMYAESIALSFGLYSMTTGIISRRRPLTFNTDVDENGLPEVPNDVKLGKTVQESFYSGHTTIAATATFFGARVFTDFRPHSKLVPFVWGAAVAVPAFTAFARYKAGKHFPSDVVTGYAVGAAVGYFIPVLHRIKDDRLSLFPAPDGLGIVYRL